MKNKLIELIEKQGDELLAKHIPLTSNNLADYLIANGVIVPPCKVGDWVWYIRNGKPNKAKIEELQYSASKHGYFSDDWLFHAYDFKEKEEVSFWRDDIGKTVFLTREEAEQALKGGAE